MCGIFQHLIGVDNDFGTRKGLYGLPLVPLLIQSDVVHRDVLHHLGETLDDFTGMANPKHMTSTGGPFPRLPFHVMRHVFQIEFPVSQRCMLDGLYGLF